MKEEHILHTKKEAGVFVVLSGKVVSVIPRVTSGKKQY